MFGVDATTLVVALLFVSAIAAAFFFVGSIVRTVEALERIADALEDFIYEPTDETKGND